MSRRMMMGKGFSRGGGGGGGSPTWTYQGYNSNGSGSPVTYAISAASSWASGDLIVAFVGVSGTSVGVTSLVFDPGGAHGGPVTMTQVASNNTNNFSGLYQCVVLVLDRDRLVSLVLFLLERQAICSLEPFMDSRRTPRGIERRALHMVVASLLR